MQTNIIRILIVSISIAVISLIGMQFYWVRSSVHLRQEEFSRNVRDALKSVSEYLEWYEEASQIKALEQNRYLFIDSEADKKILESGGDTTYDFMMVEHYVKTGDQIRVSVTEELGGVTVKDITETHEFELPEFSSNGENENLKDKRYAPSHNFSLSPEFRKNLSIKSAYVGEIAKSLTKINFAELLEDRIDSSLLDSLLHLAFLEHGINTVYEFGIFDHTGIFRFGYPFQMSSKLEQSHYKTRLYKHDLFGKPGYLKVYFPQEKGFVLKSSLLMLLTSILVVLAIIYIFYWSVKAIITQKKNSDIKNDFINNMTHELKTPISTISLAVEVLNDPAMSNNKDLLSRYLRMINEENKRLGMLVEEVLQSAALDRSAFKLKNETIAIDQLVKEVVGKMGMKLKEKSGTVSVDIDSSGTYLFNGDKVHLTNVLYNLMDNAIKYSREKPEIKIEVLNVVNQIAIKVTDNGIGISKEHLKKVFEKLYRVPTGNLHDVKGFGLGLNYVKTIVSRHLGSVDVKSVLGKGSTFIIYLPLNKINTNNPQVTEN